MENERYYLDSNTVIAMIETSRALSAGQSAFIEGIDAGTIEAVSSEIALAECLVRPFREGDAKAAGALLEFLDDRPTLPLIRANRDAMVAAARHRAFSSMKLPDAIHVACADLAGCTVFVSADQRIRLPDTMRRVSIEEIGSGVGA